MGDDHMPPSLSAPGCPEGARERRARGCARQRIGISGLRSGDAQIDSDSSSGGDARHWLGSPWWRPRLVQLSEAVACPARRGAWREIQRAFRVSFCSKQVAVSWDDGCQASGMEVCGICVFVCGGGGWCDLVRNSGVESLRNAIEKQLLAASCRA